MQSDEVKLLTALAPFGFIKREKENSGASNSRERQMRAHISEQKYTVLACGSGSSAIFFFYALSASGSIFLPFSQTECLYQKKCIALLFSVIKIVNAFCPVLDHFFQRFRFKNLYSVAELNDPRHKTFVHERLIAYRKAVLVQNAYIRI